MSSCLRSARFSRPAPLCWRPDRSTRFLGRLLFASGDAAVALGVARSCLSAFFELAGAKTPRAMQAMLRDQPMVQAAVGQSEANLRSGRAFLTEAARELWTEAISTGTITLDRRAALRLATTHAIRLAVHIVDTVYRPPASRRSTRELRCSATSRTFT